VGGVLTAFVGDEVVVEVLPTVLGELDTAVGALASLVGATGVTELLFEAIMPTPRIKVIPAATDKGSRKFLFEELGCISATVESMSFSNRLRSNSLNASGL
jgi:hypothetical protein